MDNFLDTCIILAKFDEKNKFHKNSNDFIGINKNLIISFYQEKKEIPFLFFRKEKMIMEAIKYSSNSNYLPDLKDLTQKDKIIFSKMLTKMKLGELTKQELIIEFRRDFFILKQGVMNFIKNGPLKKVIPLEKIDLLLVEQIKDKISNTADSNILASAIQEHQENKLIIVTNDAKDIKKEYLLEVLKGTKYSDVPEIKYLF